ncbi:MAG: 6-carboxytetrahydropterin synthase QueD [Kiritimatiellae bacterium]|nr:6-carboxytetrahydropterin synthase QueD [Kiritimatiellia bacterium]
MLYLKLLFRYIIFNMFEISIKSHFCGAHRLAGYQGPCVNLHGHNWEVAIFLRGAKPNRLGMLVDFKEVKEALQGVLGRFDHRNLNDLPIFKKTNPTAENIARLIFNELAPDLKSSKYCLHRVRVSESAGTSACYGPRL